MASEQRESNRAGTVPHEIIGRWARHLRSLLAKKGGAKITTDSVFVGDVKSAKSVGKKILPMTKFSHGLSSSGRKPQFEAITLLIAPKSVGLPDNTATRQLL